MKNKYKTMSFFERLKSGLEDSLAYTRGELNLRTTTLPAPPPRAGAEEIARLRKRLRMSQAVFAAILNVSYKTVQSWEQGVRQPADAALRMLQVIGKRPQVVRMIFSSPDVSARNGAAKRRRHRAPEKVAV